MCPGREAGMLPGAPPAKDTPPETPQLQGPRAMAISEFPYATARFQGSTLGCAIMRCRWDTDPWEHGMAMAMAYIHSELG